MNGSTELRKVVVAVWLVASVLTACSEAEQAGDTPSADAPSAGPLVAEGRDLYEQTCATCHGSDLRGTGSGPPFLDPIYAPNHHPDESFYAAVANGVQPHYWDFGPMLPQLSVTQEDVAAIIAYVRSEQQEAGITEDPDHP